MRLTAINPSLAWYSFYPIWYSFYPLGTVFIRLVHFIPDFWYRSWYTFPKCRKRSRTPPHPSKFFTAVQTFISRQTLSQMAKRTHIRSLQPSCLLFGTVGTLFFQHFAAKLAFVADMKTDESREKST
jgi:hypothetical protein